MKHRRSLRPALKALATHRVRAALAVSSIAVGVAALIVANAIGTGIQRDIGRQIDNTGANLLVVRPAFVKRVVARKDVKGTVRTLRLDDFDAIAELASVAEAIPAIESPVKVKAGPAATNTKVLGTGPEFPAVRRFRIRAGRFFDADDDRMARRVAVLGARVANALFTENPVGQPVRIRGVPFEVIGVLAAKGVVAGDDEDNQVVVPVRTALRRLFNATWLNTIFVSVDESRGMGEAQREIGAVLVDRHRIGPDEQADFEIQNMTTFLALQQQTAGTLRRGTSAVAVVALVVGGTGILALMLLAVKERTGEIGLRMAVGAQPRDIFLQFLFEATLLAIGGGTSGIIVGVAGAAVVAFSTTWKIAAPWEALAVSLGATLAIGIGIGALPARRASLFPPIQALRTE